MQTTDSPGLMTCSSSSRRKPATLAALAGSQPNPYRATRARCSRISSSLTSRTTPSMKCNARNALGRLTGRLISIALATVLGKWPAASRPA